LLMLTCAVSGCCGVSRPWWTRPARAGVRKPATTRRCVWRPVRWRLWSWRANSCAATSVTFLQQLRAQHPESLIVIWDNGPAHGGAPLRAYLSTPDLRLRLVRLPAYSPDFNPDEHIWGWVRAEVTANTCFGTKTNVREKVGTFVRGLIDRTDEVKR